MRVTVVGTGYVGLVSGACLADLGHRVVCLDTDQAKIDKLKQGVMPIFEKGLEEIVRRNVQADRLFFSTDFSQGIPGAEIVLLAVGTPSAANGEVDMRFMDRAADMIGETMDGYLVVVDKSTVPVGTTERVASIIKQRTSLPFDVVSNPEFLREGQAVYDFLHPSRIILGSDSSRALEAMQRMYAHLDCPKLTMNPRSAELTKYAANAFLATKLSFINEVAQVCEAMDADVDAVAQGIGLDPRIGKQFLRAGLGWGGSCFPKDVLALSKLGESVLLSLPVVNAAITTNRTGRFRIVDRLTRVLGDLSGKTVTVLGLAFKDDTDDTRESPAVDIVRELGRRGATVRAYDPVARVTSEQVGFELVQATNAYEAARGAMATILATEWDEFRALDLPRLKTAMAGDLLMDARNLLNVSEVLAQGFKYMRIGRKDAV